MKRKCHIINIIELICMLIYCGIFIIVIVFITGGKPDDITVLLATIAM